LPPETTLPEQWPGSFRTASQEWPPADRQASEHGLGHLLNSTDPDGDDRDWINEVWRLTTCQALKLPCEEPEWLDRAALPRARDHRPDKREPFADCNRGRRSPREHVRPATGPSLGWDCTV